ncbi:MAG: GNAT family N-acetyltransferase [Myxococcales bacterium]|nr:GNAT family N-acetyltransferase [Myxococcales bacterium]
MTEPTDGVITLRLVADRPAAPARGWLRALHFEIVTVADGERVGRVDLRLGYTTDVVRYGGHIGYGVDERHRGHGYAARACLLCRPHARAHGMDVLWITCNPDNWASRKTCERIGAALVEIVALPEDNDQYQRGETHKCRYRWIVY